MAAGFRITEDGSFRVSSSLDRRITEQFVNVLAVVNSTGTLTALASVTQPLATSLSSVGIITPLASLTIPIAASLNSVGTIGAFGGFLASIQASLVSSGSVLAQNTLTKNASSSLIGTLGFYSVASLYLNPLVNLAGYGGVSSIPSLSLKGMTSLLSSGSVSASAYVTSYLGASLVSSLTVTIYPVRIVTGASLEGGTGILTATATVIGSLSLANLAASGHLNGNLEMIHSAVVDNASNRRVTESGLPRITDDGNFRTLFGVKNLITSTLTPLPTLTYFSGTTSAFRDGSFKPVAARVFRNGVWVTPKIYTKNNNTWKRVF